MTPVVPPTVIDDVYTAEELELLFGVLRREGPWRLILAQHFATVEEFLAQSGAKETVEAGRLTLSDVITPAFRGYFGAKGMAHYGAVHDIYYGRKQLELVKSMHGAQYGIPHTFLFNLRTPAHSYDAGHFDAGSWRGMDVTNTPVWLIAVMAKSGLFDAWEVKSGEVVTYFYSSDVDGGFTYWPDGPDRAPARVPAPLWNSGVLTNNQRMYHRGEANGPRERRTLPGLRLDSVVEAVGDDGWVVRNGDDVIGRYSSADTRVLFHYSALVFDDLADAKRYLDHTDDLTAEKAIGMLLDDLRRRGARIVEPTDPLTDTAFIEQLSAHYAMAPQSYPPEAPLDRIPALSG